MNNLELLELVHKPSNDIFSNVKFFDQTPDFIYFIHNGSLYKYNFNENTREEICPQQFENIICLKVLHIEHKICVVTNRNLYIIDPEGVKEVQEVECGHEIEAVSWNPTEELVVIVSESGNVATFSIDYENAEVFPQGESNVDSKIPDTVYVGWGSKETQFRGSEGKLKRNQTPVEAKPVFDQKPTISWRGNGEMFVVNYWKEESRRFIVFESPCSALYRSAECLGMQSPISWRPTGNMIATLTNISNRQSIVIFEKNGQKRFSFNLKFGDEVTEIKWSPCAQILTIASRNSSTNKQNIHLLTSSNYKWYEKQRLTFTTDNPLLGFDWLETTQFTYKLRAITSKDVINYTFRHIINKNKAICAVIDGEILQITNFENAVIPPIMSQESISNDKPINVVVIGQNSIVIVDSGNTLTVFDSTFTITNKINLKEIINDLPEFPLAGHHFKILDRHVYFAVETESETVFYTLDIETSDLNFVSATCDAFRHLAIIPDNADISGLKHIDSNLFIDDSKSNLVYQDVNIYDNQVYNCQLTSNCHFYVNDHKLNDTVNSFVIFDSYLLYTTKLNELFCLRFGKDLLEVKSENYRRSIEQSATIVAAIPNSPQIVLQLPRGNLETISCRLISIDILDRLLNSQNWEEALRFIRLEKLNANLLFDLSPGRFLGQIDQFITGAKTINELNSIVQEFEEGNVLNTVYKNWGECVLFPGKIAAIFGAIFKYFDEVDYAPYISTIMIINLNFFTLKGALVYVQDLLRRSYEDLALKQSVMEAINILKNYGCDQEQLYTETLLLYDLDLAHFVASRCQLDPRVYEPHINNLKNLIEVERRFSINVYGKKPKAAIGYLLLCPNKSSTEIEEFITNHRVSREAYETCKRNSPHFQNVSRLFAQDLSRKGCHYEAGVVLKRCDLLEEALEEFKLGLKWREVVNILEELKIDGVAKLTIVNEMAMGLVRNHVIKDAAIMYEFYANNYEMAVKILIENYYFEEAIHIAKKHNRGDIIVSDIIPILSKHKSYLEEKLTDLDNTFSKYKSRLAEVRRNKANRFNNVGYEDDDRNDLFSDAGSVISRSSRSSRSRSSTASSRNRRKEEKKKQDLREGGVYEDIALVRAIHCIIKEIYSKGQEAHSCSILLLQESDVCYKSIKNLHDLYWKIDNNIKNSLTNVWPPHFYVNGNTDNIQELADLENFEHLDIEFRTPPTGHNLSSLNLFKAS